jgi:hypothetical protein
MAPFCESYGKDLTIIVMDPTNNVRSCKGEALYGLIIYEAHGVS